MTIASIGSAIFQKLISKKKKRKNNQQFFLITIITIIKLIRRFWLTKDQNSGLQPRMDQSSFPKISSKKKRKDSVFDYFMGLS